jgi:hypothetical protein
MGPRLNSPDRLAAGQQQPPAGSSQNNAKAVGISEDQSTILHFWVYKQLKWGGCVGSARHPRKDSPCRSSGQSGKNHAPY